MERDLSKPARLLAGDILIALQRRKNARPKSQKNEQNEVQGK